MPLPLIPLAILGLSGVSGIKGAYNAAMAGKKIKEIQKEYNARRESFEQRESTYKARYDAVNERLSELGQLRLEAMVTLGEAAEFIRKAKVKDRELFEVHNITLEQLNEWHGSSFEAAGILNGVTKSVAAGAATASAVYGAVGALGTASTGAAITGLSGAAATSATMAWLGGGSLAVGGGGIALGTTVLGGVVAGPALLVAGFFAAKKAEQVQTEVAAHLAAMDVAEANIGLEEARLGIIDERIGEVILGTTQIKTILHDTLAVADPDNVEDVFGVAKLAKSLGQLLDVQVIPRQQDELALESQSLGQPLDIQVIPHQQDELALESQE